MPSKNKKRSKFVPRYERVSERSPYWDDFEEHHSERDTASSTHPQEKLNLVPEQDHSPSTPQLLMGEAVDHLQGRQKEVYLLTMREGKSLAEAAEILGIEKGSAQVYRARAIKFIERYCQEAIAKGRV